MNRKYVFTSESVTEGHPDKIADQISDAVLDTIIEKDKNCRVACETLVTTGLTLIAGEITSTYLPDFTEIARSTIKSIGYNNSSMGFDWETCSVIVALDKQSPDISQGVTEGEGLFKEQGAGDQGLMFGFACNETEEYMPLPIILAHKLSKQLAEVRKSGEITFLRPDGKTQVSILYEGRRPVQVNTIVVSAQHTPDATYECIREEIIEKVIRKIVPEELITNKTQFLINPTGRFVVGGPHGDCGLTGRKIIADTYGGHGSHGGGAFSGKDPSKVDRSASYMARYIAKNIVAAGITSRCEVQIAYAIGYPDPVSLMINGFDDMHVSPESLEAAVREIFPLKPAGIIKHLSLLRPIYKKTAVYGHFGRNEPEFTWERIDKVEDLRNALGL